MSEKIATVEDLISSESAGSKSRPKLTKTGKILLGITGASFVGVFAAAVPFLLPAMRRICLPYVPATTEQVSNVMSLLMNRKSGRLVDLGSGDGRIVIEAARRGFQAHGVELNPWLVLYSRLQALRLRFSGAPGRASFSVRDLFKHDLGAYDHVVIFGVDSMMPLLRVKLVSEMSEHCTVIACRFPLPCNPSQIVGEGLDAVWLYTRSDVISGDAESSSAIKNADGSPKESASS